MPDFRFDENKRQISRCDSSRADALLSRLSEGFFSDWSSRAPRILRPFLQLTDEITGNFFRSRLTPQYEVVPNRIAFAAFQDGYTCNVKYIADKILERHLDYQMIFLVPPEVYNDPAAYGFPPEVYVVKKQTAEAFYVLATSRFWIDNGLNCVWRPIPRKADQIYLNTWHGSLGIKRLGGNRHWKMVASFADRQISAFLTNSTFDERVFSSFCPHAEHLKFGHPRNDLLFNKEKTAAARAKIYGLYQIPEHVKLVLYAPTFRDNRSDPGAVQISFDSLLPALEQRFGGEWMVLNRLHHHDLDQSGAENAPASSRVIDASRYPDIQELMAACEAGITDYSSWIFDFLFTGRPGFIYAADIEKYRHDRGFYYSLDKTPFSIASSADQLSENILAFDEDYYNRKILSFLKRMGAYEDGSASDRTVDYIISRT